MNKMELAICIGDEEYQKRFTNCFMNHYKEEFQLHIFTDIVQLDNIADKCFSFIVIGDYDIHWTQNLLEAGNRVLFLYDNEQEIKASESEYFMEQPSEAVYTDDSFYQENVLFVDKYQEVHKIVDILRSASEREEKVMRKARVQYARKIGVYALSGSEMQLPFSVTLSSVWKEQGSVLVVDLQENSGITQLQDTIKVSGLEELLVLTETGKYTKGRIVSSIGHLTHCDYIYPAKNSECLCEADKQMYTKMLQILEQELKYNTIILNFGVRFQGFFELMNECDSLYLLHTHGNTGKWREKEFLEEMSQKGYETYMEKIIQVELPILADSFECERLVEQWRWNDFGDFLRKQMPLEKYIG